MGTLANKPPVPIGYILNHLKDLGVKYNGWTYCCGCEQAEDNILSINA